MNILAYFKQSLVLQLALKNFFYHKVSAKQTILCAEFSWGIFCERVNSYVTFASIEADYLGKPRYSSVTGTHKVPGRN